MDSLTVSIKNSINSRLAELEREENRLKTYISGRLRVADDSYYVGGARSKARREAEAAQQKVDDIIGRKLELLKELKSL